MTNLIHQLTQSHSFKRVLTFAAMQRRCTISDAQTTNCFPDTFVLSIILFTIKICNVRGDLTNVLANVFTNGSPYKCASLLRTVSSVLEHACWIL